MLALFKEAVDYMADGQANLAEKNLNIILDKVPDDERSLSLLGHSLLAQKKNEEAIKILIKLTNSKPKSESAFIELATAYLAVKDFTNAENAFLQSVKLNPKQSEAWLFLGNLAMQRSDRKNARIYFANAENNDPFRKLMQQAFDFMKQNNFAKAEEICRKILEKHSAHPAALYVLAELASKVGAIEEAVKIVSQALKHSPYNVKLLHFLTKTFSALGRFDKAVEAAQKTVLIEPENAAFWIVLGGELANMGRNDESIIAYEQAVDIACELSTSHFLLGHIYKIAGRKQDCINTYKKALSVGDINGAVYWALADIKAYHFSESDVVEMIEYFNDKKEKPVQRSQAAFAIGKAFEDQKEYKKAFEYYRKANNLKPNVEFNPEEYNKICEVIVQSYSNETLQIQGSYNQSVIPIFIVGLPRSGSTLIEQILASHSEIEGTMELFQLPNLIRKINILGGRKTKKTYPESISCFSGDELSAFGQSYLDETSIFRTGKKYFIDKLPPNFQQVGLIHKILPQAKIIDARRHPMSGGLSAYKQHFASGHGFSYKLENIGAYYKSYLKLMDYWQSVLPNKVLTVQYEDMVENTQQQIRNILLFCGLGFEEQCLKFYENKRAVRTPSSEQVRQPIYNSSTHQWKNFEESLNPLKLALGDEILERFKTWS